MSDQAALPRQEDAAARDNTEEGGRRRSLLAKVVLAVLLVIILILLLTVRSCSFLDLTTFVPPAEGTDELGDCLECHADHDSSDGAHKSSKVPCLRCHTKHSVPNADGTLSDPGPFLVATPRELCVICHGSVGRSYDDTHQHPPFEQGECTACHDPHGTPYPNLLVKPPNEMCVTCHNVADSPEHLQVHPPFAGGDCVACHSPHASDFPGITKDPQPEVCLACHDDIARQVNKQYAHSPAGEECTKCHVPHVSDISPLLQASPPRLCYRCHGGVEPLFKLSSRHPVPEKLNCTTCHFVHGSDFPKLLHASGNAVCGECHPAKVADVAETPHSKASREGREPGSCRNCHLWHGSSEGPLLPKREVALCAECHETKTHRDTNHPNDRPFYDPWHRETMRCSSCHDPHGTAYPQMVRKVKDGLCLTCHPGVGVTF